MKKQIKRVSIMQTSKIVALSYPIFGLIHTAIGIVGDPTFGRNQFHLYPINMHANIYWTCGIHFYGHWVFTL